ncbi:outer dynein arm-docking complex subunit 4-like [Vespa velutina]|uniref:outer dynein arm-docking complex subunit 4-like n=1 Tax=Vespa velutina TaxID=202808 RepID=UPI001FB406B9|nr:outer dynein arm-docking complex subunit 4-like [Vespa velutina]
MTSTLIRTDSKARSATILTDDEIKDEFGNIEETRKAIERAVNRAHNTKKTNSTVTNSIGNDRQFAQALHYEADQLYQKGNYETALVLYHRAAKVCPRDGSHSTAARRTATMINSWQNPSKRLRKFLSKTKPESELTIALCPEVAAIKAANVLRESPDFSSVNEVLRELSFQFSYFDEHKNLWDRSSTTSSFSKLHLTRSNAMLNRLRNVADTTLKKLETAFHSGNVKASFQYAKELLAVSSGIGEPKRYEVEAHRYLALTHVMLGRHDRAVNNVARMVYLAKISNDSVLILQSLLTLGKVHLSFDHLDAAARAWEHLSKNLEEPILRAWIHHEIGRCYLETGKFVKAFNMGNRTLEIAEDIGSNKWILHGKLLKAQTLVKLGRFAEALEELRICARITEEEGDTPTLSYIQNLITDLTRLLRRITFVIKDEVKRVMAVLLRKSGSPSDPQPVVAGATGGPRSCSSK